MKEHLCILTGFGMHDCKLPSRWVRRGRSVVWTTLSPDDICKAAVAECTVEAAASITNKMGHTQNNTSCNHRVLFSKSGLFTDI